MKHVSHPIVVLGGMGPQASIRFHELLIKKSQHYHQGQGDQFPYIVHLSLPVPDFIGNVNNQTAALSIFDGLEPTVASLRPRVLALACNTAHRLVPRARLLQSEAFISMLEVTAHALQRDGIHAIGLLSSPVTVQTRLYQKQLEKLGIATIVPDTSQLREVEQVIRAVIGGAAGKHEQMLLATIAQSLGRRGAQTILLGCTELPLIFDPHKTSLRTYDCLDLYADAVIARYYCDIKGTSATRSGQASFARSPLLGYNKD